MIELLNPKIESLASRRSSSDPNDSILGFNDLILGFNDSILGLNYSTLEFNDSILGFDDSVLGFNYSTLGFNDSTLGFNDSILGFNDLLFNDLFARKSARYNTTPKICFFANVQVNRQNRLTFVYTQFTFKITHMFVLTYSSAN